MITRYAFNTTTWLDVQSPTGEEIRAILEEVAIPAEFAGDLAAMTPHTETKASKDAVKITLDFPIVKRNDISHPHEIKFIATKTHLLTIRFEDIEVIHRFAKEFEVLSTLNRAGKRATGGHLFLTLLAYVYDAQRAKLDYLESRMHDIENAMFNDNEREILIDISQVGRKLVAFQQTISAHERALRELKPAMESAFAKSYGEHVTSIILNYEHQVTRVRALLSTLEIIRDTDNALLSAKQNEVMKMLTIMAFITFPLSLFSSMFGMNTTSMPLAGHPHDFWIIVGIMVFVSVGFFVFFKYKRWL